MVDKAILITGGCGFIGTSLIKKLKKCNSQINIRVLDSLVTGTLDDLAEVTSYQVTSASECRQQEGVCFVEGDIRDAKVVNLCAKGVGCIVHLAANTGVGPSVDHPRLDMESNVIGIFNALEAARANKVNKFIFASSGAPVGEVTPPIHEELPPHPVSPYGASKLAGEGYCSAYYQTFGVNTVCLRFGNVYGPRSKHKSSVVAKFIRQSMNGETCAIFGDGNQTRDFLFIDDLLEAILSSMHKEIGGEIFQIASGREKTVGDVARLIAASLEKRGIVMKLKNDSPRLGDVARNYSDTQKAKEMLGWQATTALETGIERTIDYFLGVTGKGSV